MKSGKKDVRVKSKETVNIPCCINTGYIERNMPVLFEKLRDGCFPFELELCDSLITLKRGNAARLSAMCINNSSHDVIVPNPTMLGKLTQVRSATPFQVIFNDDNGKEKTHYSGNMAPENNGLLSNVVPSNKFIREDSRNEIAIRFITRAERYNTEYVERGKRSLFVPVKVMLAVQ